MVKRYIWKIGPSITYLTILSLVIFGIASVRRIRADARLERYYQAKPCPSKENCRQHVIVTITRSISFQVYIPGGKGLSYKKNLYEFSAQINNSDRQSFNILPGRQLIFKDFDDASTYIPAFESGFAEAIFPVGVSALVEIWDGDIVYLYMDPEFISFSRQQKSDSPSSDQGPQIITAATPRTYDGAMPTSKHPAVIADNRQSTYYFWSVVFYGLLLIFVLRVVTLPIQTLRKVKENEDEPN